MTAGAGSSSSPLSASRSRANSAIVSSISKRGSPIVVPARHDEVVLGEQGERGEHVPLAHMLRRGKIAPASEDGQPSE